VEAPATRDSFAPPKEKKKWIKVRTWIDWNPIRELLGTSALKEGADVAVGEWSPRRNRATGKWCHEQKLQKEGAEMR
jgi:hypothetical protein